MTNSEYEAARIMIARAHLINAEHDVRRRKLDEAHSALNLQAIEAISVGDQARLHAVMRSILLNRRRLADEQRECGKRLTEVLREG